MCLLMPVSFLPPFPQRAPTTPGFYLPVPLACHTLFLLNRAIAGQVFVPKENCAFMFAMTEVRCPQPPKTGETRKRSHAPQCATLMALAPAFENEVPLPPFCANSDPTATPRTVVCCVSMHTYVGVFVDCAFSAVAAVVVLCFALPTSYDMSDPYHTLNVYV